MAAHRRLDQIRADPYAGGLRKPDHSRHCGTRGTRVFAAPKRIGLRSHIWPSGGLVKSPLVFGRGKQKELRYDKTNPRPYAKSVPLVARTTALQNDPDCPP